MRTALVSAAMLVVAGLISWPLSHAQTVSCHKNEPVDDDVKGCEICYTFDDDTSADCRLSNPNPVNQSCTDPTNEDGILCATSSSQCSGALQIYQNLDCGGSPFRTEMTCPNHDWIAGSWWDMGNTPVCPTP